MRESEAAVERQPGCELKLVLEECSFHVAGRFVALLDGRLPGGVSRLEAEKRVIALVKAFESKLRVVLPRHNAQRHLATQVVRAAIVVQDKRSIVDAAHK